MNELFEAPEQAESTAKNKKNAPAIITAESVGKPPADDREVAYIPMGESKEIKLSVGLVKRFLMPPTRKGVHPTDLDAMKFIMLCQARELNPWVQDAFAIGYDSEDGPQFQLVTAVQSLFKRAELNPNYGGIESGVIVRKKGDRDTAPEFRSGSFYMDDEVLLGGWAKVHRKDHSEPHYAAVKLATFSRNTSIWRNNPEGMIVKCASAAALRSAFPNQLSGLYVREEMEIHGELAKVEERPRMTLKEKLGVEVGA